jgi:hypothetical protein
LAGRVWRELEDYAVTLREVLNVCGDALAELLKRGG